MTITKLIKFLQQMPENIQDQELFFFSTDDGKRYRVRTDVSQAQFMGGKLNVFITEVN